MKIYQVGGAVRDRLLHRPVVDRDWVVVGASPETLLELGYRQVGRDFPVFLHPKTGEEYALARRERKSGPGYRGFDVDTDSEVTLEEDLARRDLTINAMALDEGDGVIDPFGGQRDLEQGVLRHVSPAFVEDPVRLLRIARFAARLGFTVAPETLALMKAMVASGEVRALVAERVWTELARALGEAEPVRFFRVLRDCGALAEIFPEIERLFGVPQPPRHHPEIDTGVHTFMVLEQATRLSQDPRVRFAALVHDLGKGLTPPEIWPSHRGHEARSAELIEALCARLRAPREYRELALAVARHHGLVHRALELRPSRLLELLKDVDALRRPQRMEDFLLACEADARGRTGLEQRAYPQADYLREAAELARAVPAAPLLAQGLRGPDLAAGLDRERTRCLGALRERSRGEGAP